MGATDTFRMKISSSAPSPWSQLTELLPKRPVNGGRIRAYDGLRGVLALLVVLHHTWSINESALNDSGHSNTVQFLDGSLLHALVAGWQFVLAFFILSGFALTMPVLLKGAKFSWAAYYPARLLRLYLPVLASVGLAILLVLWFSRPIAGAGTAWLKSTALQQLDGQSIWMAITLNDDPTIKLNPALWRLRWEVPFPLLLPIMLMIVLVALSRMHVTWTLLTLFTSMAFGIFLGLTFIFYLGVFALGMIIACRFDAVYAWAHSLTMHLGPRFSFVGMLLMVISLYWFSADGGVSFNAANFNLMHTAQALTALMAGMLLLLLALTPTAARLLQGRLSQFLGRISFSLYLTHLPVIVALAYLLPRQLWLVHMVIAIPITLVIAWLFWFACERPSHRLAQRVQRALARSAD